MWGAWFKSIQCIQLENQFCDKNVCTYRLFDRAKKEKIKKLSNEWFQTKGEQTDFKKRNRLEITEISLFSLASNSSFKFVYSSFFTCLIRYITLRYIISNFWSRCLVVLSYFLENISIQLYEVVNKTYTSYIH